MTELFCVLALAAATPWVVMKAAHHREARRHRARLHRVHGEATAARRRMWDLADNTIQAMADDVTRQQRRG